MQTDERERSADPTSALVLDLEAVEELDTAGLQVLLWARREARGRAVPLDVVGSPVVDSVLAIAGLRVADLTTAGAVA